MGIRITGVQNLQSRISNVSERASRGAREGMEAAAEAIKDLAKQYAPVDEGSLEESIKVAKAEDSDFRNRIAYTVYVDENEPSPRGGVVGNYAVWIHEGNYNLGKKSQEKAMETGMYVGRKFLEYAVDNLHDELKATIEAKLKQGIGH